MLYNLPMIRPARVKDVTTIGNIINDAAEVGLMLHRSWAELYENVRDFIVAVDDNDTAIGVCGLKVIWSDIAEVYALAVAEHARGRGLGSQLVEACVEDARRLGIPRLMTLTYEKPFFERLGFVHLPREQLPLKVWSECLRCAKNQACDEIALVKVLDDVAAAAGPKPQMPPPGRYVVPTVDRSGEPKLGEPMDAPR